MKRLLLLAAAAAAALLSPAHADEMSDAARGVALAMVYNAESEDVSLGLHAMIDLGLKSCWVTMDDVKREMNPIIERMQKHGKSVFCPAMKPLIASMAAKVRAATQ